MSETLTNPENVTALVGHRDAITASAQVAAPQAAPGAAAAQGTSDAAAHMMTKEEAIVRLCALAFAAEDTDTLRALLLGCKVLARDGIHKRRNKAARAARAAAAKQEAATETEDAAEKAQEVSE